MSPIKTNADSLDPVGILEIPRSHTSDFVPNFKAHGGAQQAHSEIDVSAMLADLRVRMAALASDLALLGGYIAGRRGDVH